MVKKMVKVKNPTGFLEKPAGFFQPRAGFFPTFSNGGKNPQGFFKKIRFFDKFRVF